MTQNNDPLKQFDIDLNRFAATYSLARVKVESLNFIRDYRLADGDTHLYLVSEKAIIRALGKVTKVSIGPGETCKTFEEAETFARDHWSAYFRERRLSRSETEKRSEAKRQKLYRAQRKLRDEERDRQQ